MRRPNRRAILAALPLTGVPAPLRPAEGLRQPISKTDGAYSEGMEITGFQRLVFVSGQVPMDAEENVPVSFADQAQLAWRNVEAQLAAADMTLNNILKMTIFLAERRYRGQAYETRRAALGDHAPAMTIIVCDIYEETWLLEIEVVAGA